MNFTAENACIVLSQSFDFQMSYKASLDVDETTNSCSKFRSVLSKQTVLHIVRLCISVAIYSWHGDFIIRMSSCKWCGLYTDEITHPCPCNGLMNLPYITVF